MRGGRALLLLALAQLLAAHRSVEIEESLLDGVSIVSYQPLTNVVAGEYINPQIVEESESNNGLLFSPTKLLFGERSLGMPHIERVTIFNKLNRTVQLTSISGNTVHFHSSFFENKVLLPNSNTSFNVVFLGRLEGTVDSNLFIHTSEGIYKYMITGTSIPSAYRLQPLLKLNLPLNATFSPLIYIHNPHDHPIQVTEVYSAGGSIALELPGGGLEGPQTLWFLPPHTTRPIIGVRYNPSIVSSQGTQTVRDKEFSQPYVTYVRFKLHGTASIFSSVLIVAVEIFIAPDGGPYTVPQFVDFGLGGTKDPPKKVRLLMGNSSPRPIRISSINVDTVDGLPWGGLRILSTARTLLPPLSPPDIHVATLNLNWKHIYDSGQCCGKIIIKTKQDQRLELPYTSQAYSGGLIMNDESVTRYLSSEAGITVVRQVLLKNVFNVGLFVTDIILGKGIEKYFEISAFYPQDFKVNTIQHGFRIQLKSWTKSLKFESKITLITNISAQVIPVYIYNGKLDVYMSVPPRPTNKGTLDLGLVGVSSTSRATLILRNANPVNVCLKSSGTDLPGASIQLLGCAPQIPSTPDVENSPSANITACTCIQPRWCAVYIISVLAPASAVTLRGELWVATVHERLVVPVALTAANGGRLSQSDPSKFDDCFPGTICSIPLTIKSSFPVDMDVLSVDAVPSDRRLYYNKMPSVASNYSAIEYSSTIVASSMSKIGWLHYDSYLYCDNKCYTGLDLNSSVGQQWLSRITLPVDTFELDSHLANSRFNIFLNLTSLSSHKNMSVRVDTTQVRNHMLSMQIPLIWPKLYSGPLILEAPLTQVGSSSFIHFDIVNPSQTRPLFVQLVLEWMVGNNERIHSFPDRLKPPDCPNDDWCFGTFDQAFYFPNLTHGRNANKYTADAGNLNEVCYDQSGFLCERSKDIYIENSIHWLPTYLLPHPDSFVFTLLPGEKRNITVGFLTQYPRKISSVLYIRNNLTIIEALRLNGEGVVASLKFGNRKPGSSTPLLFDLTEKHLKDCDRDKIKKAGSAPNFTVKRTFVARNSGSIPVQVTRFFINGIECEGYGFRVLNCEPFELAQNGTHKVDIAFTPDFTLTKIQRLLILETSLNDYVNYTLVSSIPVSSTAKCAAILRRPPWEGNLLGITLFMLICIGLCVILAGCYESYKILTIMSVSLLRDTKVHPFDLRAIGEIGLNKKMEEWEFCGNNLENKRAKDIIKIPSWAFDDNILNEESKSNIQCPKYEEFNPTINIRAKKKLNKRSSNSDAPITELPSDHEVAAKGKKIIKELNEDKESWKNIFARNTILLKNSTKYASRNNSSDSSDVNKLVNNATSDVLIDKQQKLTDGQKCSINYNAKNDTVECASQNHFENTTKHSSLKCLSNDSHSGEDDSSSTSTESSNNDDGDKENDNSMSSSSNKSASSSNGKNTNLVNMNKKGKCISQCRDSYEGDGEDEEYDHKSQSSQSSSTQNEVNQRWTKNRDVISSPMKLNIDNDKQKSSEHNKSSFDNPNFTKQNKKEITKNTKKRDKQPFSKKRSLDKSIVFCGKSDNNNTPATFNVPRSSTSTPPAISTVWENKASFSDVVARSENTFSNNFVNRPKETPEFRNLEQKTIANPISSSNIISHSSSAKFKSEEPRKCDTHNKTDLGPIGSNYYSKKGMGSWPDSHSDIHNKHYRNPIQHMNKPLSHHEDDTNTMKPPDNNSFFLNSNSYFSGNNFTDMTIMNNSGTAAHKENMLNNFGSIGSALDTNNSQSMSRMQNIYNTNLCDNMPIGSGHMQLRDVSNYDTGIQHPGYQLNSSPQLGGNIFDISPTSNLMEHPNSIAASSINNNGQTSSGFDPWENSINDQLNSIGTVSKSDSIFEYDPHSFYTDNNSWTGSSNLWNPSPQPPNSVMQNNHTMANSDIQIQSRNTDNLVPASDHGAAEWLWGYNSSGNNTESVDNNIPTHSQYETQATVQPGVFHSQPQFHQPMNPPEMNNFDPYRSLSSIWSTGSTMDLWSTNQSNYERNNDLNNHDHKNNYQ